MNENNASNCQTLPSSPSLGNGGIPFDVAEKIINDYQQHLIADGKSPKTLASYLGDIKAFVDFLNSKGAVFAGKINRFHITSYRKFLIEQSYQLNTINKKINSLHSFNQFLIVSGYQQEKVVDLKKDKVRVALGSEKEVDVFTEDEVERIIFHIQDSQKVSSRDRTIIYLLLYTGVRVSELVNIKLKDIDFLTLSLIIPWGKGGKQRDIPLKAEVLETIKEYLETERKAHKQAESLYLLLTQRAGKMDRDAVNKLLNRLGAALGMKMNPHKFRHTFCTRLLKKGVEITTVAKIAGHASIQTTAAFYINTSRQDKLDAVNLL